MNIKEILMKNELSRQNIVDLLTVSSPVDIELIRETAENLLLTVRGNKVYFRGLVEFSNICSSDCYYCGIRKGNELVNRYLLSKDQIIDAAVWCANQGYGSVVL